MLAAPGLVLTLVAIAMRRRLPAGAGGLPGLRLPDPVLWRAADRGGQQLAQDDRRRARAVARGGQVGHHGLVTVSPGCCSPLSRLCSHLRPAFACLPYSQRAARAELTHTQRLLYCAARSCWRCVATWIPSLRKWWVLMRAGLRVQWQGCVNGRLRADVCALLCWLAVSSTATRVCVYLPCDSPRFVCALRRWRAPWDSICSVWC